MQLIESGSIQDNHEKYVDIQREIMELNRNSFENYVEDHLFFPIRAKKKKIRAIVYVQFIINEKGKAVETNVIRSVDKDLDKEAIRLVNSRNVNTVPEETFVISPSNTSVVNTSTTVEQTVEIGIKSL